MKILWFRHRKNFRNDESDSYVPDYEELEVVTEVVTEVSLSAELKWYRQCRFHIVKSPFYYRYIQLNQWDKLWPAKAWIQMLEITESATEAPPVVEPYINSKYDPNRVWLDQGSESEWTPNESDAEQLEYDVKLDLSYE